MQVPRPYDAVMISLRPIDEANREAVEALDVSPEQQRFVSNAADSIREAAREPDGRALYWAIYAGETPVGFVMISDDVGGPGYFPQYLWNCLSTSTTRDGVTARQRSISSPNTSAGDLKSRS